jgi:threonine dehydratase
MAAHYHQDYYERVRPYVKQTPVVTNPDIDAELGAQFFFKCENLQQTGSFKFRGAIHSLLQLDEAEKRRGVVTVSSGNHGAAMAKAGKVLGIDIHVIVPQNITPSKLANIQQYKPNIVYSEPGLAGRSAAFSAFCDKHDCTFIPPYNAMNIVLGQASAAYELVREINDLDNLLVPVGGGGLASGTILACREFSPQTRIIGAEPANADDAYRSLKEDRLLPQYNPDTICDGLRTGLGDITFPIIRDGMQTIILVSEDEVVSAMKSLHRQLKMVIEPSSATVFAAVLKSRELFRNKKVGMILSGGNLDMEMFDGND